MHQPSALFGADRSAALLAHASTDVDDPEQGDNHRDQRSAVATRRIPAVADADRPRTGRPSKSRGEASQSPGGRS